MFNKSLELNLVLKSSCKLISCLFPQDVKKKQKLNKNIFKKIFFVLINLFIIYNSYKISDSIFFKTFQKQTILKHKKS